MKLTGIIFGAGLSAILSGQAATPLTGPVQGLVFDAPSRSIRAVEGSLGGAALGETLWSDLDFAASRGRRGIGCKDGHCFYLGGAADQPMLGELTGAPEGAAWSDDGSVLALYSRSGAWVQMWRAGRSERVSVSSLGGELAGVEIRHDGGQVALAIRGEHQGVYELTAEGNFVPLLSAVEPAAMVYSGDTLLVLAGAEIVERAADGVVTHWNLEDTGNPLDFAPGRDGEGRTVIWVVSGEERLLRAFDARTHELRASVQLGFAPTRLEPLSEDQFLLTERTTQEDVVWAYQAGRGVYFVPVTPDAPRTAAAGNAPGKVRR